MEKLTPHVGKSKAQSGKSKCPEAEKEFLDGRDSDWFLNDHPETIAQRGRDRRDEWGGLRGLRERGWQEKMPQAEET